MSAKIWRRAAWAILTLPALIPVVLGARTVLAANQAVASDAQPSTPQNLQAISQTGLLPVFAVDLQFDPAWVDGGSVPSNSPQFSHSGVNDTFQKAWDALKPTGFNMIRFSLDPSDSHSAAILANLCIWAKANNVTLIPVLKSSSTNTKSKSSASDPFAAFPPALVSLLRAGDGQAFANYTQIAYFQVEDAMNHAGLHPKITPDAARQLVVSESDALRKSEAQALQGTSVQPTPILIAASFDYELIRQGAIAGVPLDATAEQNAQASLLQYLSPYATAANIEAVNVEWFPRSISSGDVDHFASLLRQIKAALPDKQITLTTGFSSAFNSVDQQGQFFTLTFTNLSDFRASDGVSSHFLGIVFRQAFNGPTADAKPPAGSSDPSQWNWQAKGQQLSQMWSQGKHSLDLDWWLNKVQDNMGLLSSQPNAAGGMSLIPLPAQQAFQQISSTVAQVAQNSAAAAPPATVDPYNIPAVAPAAYQSPNYPDTGAMAQPASSSSAYSQDSSYSSYQASAYPSDSSMTGYASNPATGMNGGGTPGYPTGAQAGAPGTGSPYQQMLMGLLQQVTSQLTTSVVARITNGSGQISAAQYSGYSAPAPTQDSSYSSPQQSAYAAPSVSVDPNASPSSSSTTQSPSIPTSQTNASSPGQGTSPTTQQASPGQGTSTATQQASAGQGTGATTQQAPAGQGTTATTQQTSAGQAADATTQQASSGQAAQTTVAQPQIAFFGPNDASPSSSSGQIPPLAAQIVNPSNGLLIQAAQAQLLVDGKPNQVQTLGLMIPKQTHSVVFAATPASAGSHAVQVVVSVDGGGTVSASSTVKVSAPATAATGTTKTTSSNSSSSATPLIRPGVRAGAPTSFSIGAVSQSASVANGGSINPAAQSNLGPASLGGVRPTSQPTSTGIAQPAAKSVGAAGSGQVAAASSSSNNTSGNQSSVPPPIKASVGGVPSRLPPSTTGIPARPAPTGTATTVPPPGAVVAARPVPGGTNAATQSASPSRPLATGAAGASVLPSTGIPARPGPAIGSSGTPQTTLPAGSSGGSAAPGATSASIQARPGPIAVAPSGATAPSLAPTAGAPVRPGPGGITASANSQTALTTSAATTSLPITQGVDLSVSTTDIHFSPAPPVAGRETTFTAVIRNAGMAGTQGATVVFTLLADGRQADISQPVIFTIAGRGTFLGSWTTRMPSGQQMQLVVTVAASTDARGTNNQAALSFALTH